MAKDPVLDLLQSLPQDIMANTLLAPAIQKLAPEQFIASLRARLEQLAKTHHFNPGDIVEWKPGMKHMSFPAYRRQAIVVEVLPEPLINKAVGPDSPFYQEILDLRIGVIGDDGGFYVFLVPSSRFQPYILD